MGNKHPVIDWLEIESREASGVARIESQGASGVAGGRVTRRELIGVSGVVARIARDTKSKWCARCSSNRDT